MKRHRRPGAPDPRPPQPPASGRPPRGARPSRSSAPPTEFRLAGEFVELGAMLKAADLCGSGGEAKHLVQGGFVRVDGAEERRRGRKLRGGELVEAKGRAFRVGAAATPG